MANDSGRHPWELNTLQRGLVDSCFEEGQYETAIATLNQLRSSEFNPWPPHLRQVIYISLQSTKDLATQHEIDTSIQASPSKLVKQHQYQMSLNLIPPKAVYDAQKLLMAYLLSSTPAALGRALPQRRSLIPPPPVHNEGDSTVARRAACIIQCRDCWEMLHTNFLLRQSAVPSAPKVKLKRQSEHIGYSKLDSTDLNASSPVVVTEDAWPLMEWLVSLFERDEELSETHPDARHSSLLAAQLLDDTDKAYFDIPITIIMHCLAQTQPQRQRLASRLLSLLINLTSTVELDLQGLIFAVYTRIHSLEQISLLISLLNQPSATQILKFRIGLCHRLISGLGPPATGNGPKPQPRIRARVTKAVDKQEPTTVDPPTTNRSSVPATSEILRLFQAPVPEEVQSGASLTPLWCKYQLLSVYGTFQARLTPADRDSEWSKTLAETLPRIVRDVFQQKGNEASVYQRLLENQIIGWQQLVGVVH
ncbi:hypothetical protein P691DRAFT_811791 [Macrolepiota fuliginosa MF-IS2]|uniref:Uncharacterized protein n=1 Tax=Macrolepiota fuliginosa MF-IS2 TaxID=1400762 RepID=A0A9P5XRH6_9AGAR|nr:hypothetical protein P691DRAFT_811791 [Macrolepiota fuliginosa MF-IS2]